MDGEFVGCSKSEYKIDKIKYNTTTSNYTYTDNGQYKAINENKSVKQRISNYEINIYQENLNRIEYFKDDNLYKYSPIKGSEKIFYNYELQFNSENTIFVYNK